MREALAKLRGGHVEEAEVDLVMKECDEDGNGTVDELGEHDRLQAIFLAGLRCSHRWRRDQSS